MQDQQTIVVEQGADGRPLLKLAGEMTPLGAPELHRVALELAERGQDVVVACGQLEGLDLTSFQILLAFKDALVARGRALKLTGVSPELAETVDLVGLGDWLDHCPTAVPASSSTAS